MEKHGQSQRLSEDCCYAFDAIAIPIIISEADAKRVVWANRSACELFGYTLEEFQRLTVDKITHPDFRNELPANYAISCGQSGLVTFKRYVRRDGSAFLAELRANPHPANAHFVVAAIIDIDQSDRLRVDLSRSAATDPLTGLLRRDAFTSAALETIKAGHPYGLIFLDLDDFKNVNDVYGHQAGDTVLQSVGSRIRDSFRQHDLVCRLGGDEFVIFINQLDRSIVLRRIINELRMNVEIPIELPFNSLTPFASIGGVLASPGCQLSYAMNEADLAMYRAKQRAKDPAPNRHAELVQLSGGDNPHTVPL